MPSNPTTRTTQPILYELGWITLKYGLGWIEKIEFFRIGLGLELEG